MSVVNPWGLVGIEEDRGELGLPVDLGVRATFTAIVRTFLGL